MKKKYTLDRIEKNQYVFLEKPDEMNHLVIPIEHSNISLSEGDIVNITSDGVIELLGEETVIMKNKVNELLEKLKSKKR